VNIIDIVFYFIPTLTTPKDNLSWKKRCP